MTGYILKIAGEMPYTNLPFEIDLGGKNLIVTGKNGAGKTSFLNKINDSINAVIRNKQDAQVLEQNLNTKIHWESVRETNPKGSSAYATAVEQIRHVQARLDSINSLSRIEYSNNLQFAAAIDESTGVIEIFEASRQANIQQSNSPTPIDMENAKALVNQSNQSNDRQLGNTLEQYLLSLKTRLAFAKNNSADTDLVKNIENWFNSFDDNLKFLIEDSSTELVLDEERFQISIHQKGRENYTFQQLSSGYSAIFSIYAQLLVRQRYLNIAPDQLTGVVMIDEIDAHLHLSLQRKILPFLIKSFPKIQFIVSTHSPFVITSVEDVIIYDISTREQVEDLSSYSYEAVAEGLLGVNSASDILLDKVKELAQITTQKNVTERLETLVGELELVYEKLDEESKFFVNQAKLLMAKNSGGTKNV